MSPELLIYVTYYSRGFLGILLTPLSNTDYLHTYSLNKVLNQNLKVYKSRNPMKTLGQYLQNNIV